MKKKVKYINGFTLVEMLIVMGIFIILTVIGFNGFLSIRESFIARENVELIIQDIESTKLKAMNMEGGKDATWIYGFGIDFTKANELADSGDYEFFKWCSPVVDYGGTFTFPSSYGTLAPTENILPNYFTESSAPDFNMPDEVFSNFPLCDTDADYINGRLAICEPLLEECREGRTGIAKTVEISTLIDREANQMEILGSNNYIFFESLTGRAIIYDIEGSPMGYGLVAGEVGFIKDNFIPLDIVLHRKRSNKFDLITVYPNSGEVIHHVYDKNENLPVETECNPAIKCITVDSNLYRRYGIEDEINSFRD